MADLSPPRTCPSEITADLEQTSAAKIQNGSDLLSLHLAVCVSNTRDCEAANTHFSHTHTHPYWIHPPTFQIKGVAATIGSRLMSPNDAWEASGWNVNEGLLAANKLGI